MISKFTTIPPIKGKPKAGEAARASGGGGGGDDGEEGPEEASVELMELLASAAAAQGIPLDWLIRRAVGGVVEEEEEDEEIDYPFDAPPKSLEDVANFIKSDECKSIVVLAGAGMSVASGIPDFRRYVRLLWLAKKYHSNLAFNSHSVPIFISFLSHLPAPTASTRR